MSRHITAPDPIIEALVDRLPRPGEMWPEADRKLWLETMRCAFEVVYERETDITSATPNE